MTDTQPAEAADGLLAAVFTAAELSHKVFAPLTEHVPGIIQEGFGIVAGPPKLGKSWFTLDIALAVAAGGRAFGKLKVEQRPVLLLALEDSERRLQSRIKILHGPDTPPHKLHILTSLKPGEGILVGTLCDWLQHHPGGLIILDTLGRARQQRKRTDDPYLADYQAGVALKNIVDAFPGSALLGVHHTRKAPSEDFVNDLTGTLGLAGSADYILVLRRPRQSNDATLQLTGRDAPEGEYAFTVNGGHWTLAGNELKDAAAEVTNRRNERDLGDRSGDIIKIVNERATNGDITTPADITARIGLDRNAAGVYLRRLEERGSIKKVGRGVYTNV